MTNHRDFRSDCDRAEDILAIANGAGDGREGGKESPFATMERLSMLWCLVVSIVALLSAFGNLENRNRNDSLLVRNSNLQPKEIQEAEPSIAQAISSMTEDSYSKNPFDRRIEHDSSLFEDFVREHQKTYASEDEYHRRQAIFYENLATIHRHNARVDREHSNLSWRMGITSFADQSHDELPKGIQNLALHNSHRKRARTADYENGHSQENHTERTFLAQMILNVFFKPMQRLWGDIAALATQNRNHHTNHSFSDSNPTTNDDPVSHLPKFVDWRQNGVTTPVKNQGNCGSCWAFASATALESHLAIQTGKLLELSVQQLVACAPNPFSCGNCDGGTSANAYEFLASSDTGIVTEWEWGYTSGNNGTVPACHLDNDPSNSSSMPKEVASLEGYTFLEQNNYEDLLQTVANVGPVVVPVDSTHWHHYRKGIFDDRRYYRNLTTRTINHAVVVEGYGTEVWTDPITKQERSTDYWLARNSWGVLWGEDGYIRLKRDSEAPHNDCLPDVAPEEESPCVAQDSSNSTLPSDWEVCGVSGMLMGGLYPTGVHLLPQSGN